MSAICHVELANGATDTIAKHRITFTSFILPPFSFTLKPSPLTLKIAMMAQACGDAVNICSLPQELLMKIFDYLPITIYRADVSPGLTGRPSILFAQDRSHNWTFQERLPPVRQFLDFWILPDPNNFQISCRWVRGSILHTYQIPSISASILQVSYRLTQAAREVFLRNNYFLFVM